MSPRLEPPPQFTRRRFNIALGAATASTTAGLYGSAVAQSSSQSELERLYAYLNLFARDTLAGASAFCVPGADLYSLVQGRSTFQAGGIAARNDAFLVYMFDNYLPLPPPLGSSLATALSRPLRGINLSLGGIDLNLGSILAQVINTRESVRLSTLVALLLNALALVVQPASIIGPFLSPFSRLSWNDKAKVLRMLETADPQVLTVMGEVPAPLVKTLFAYLQLIALGLMAFGGFGSYSEWANLNRTTRTLNSRPVGWSLSKYQANGPVEGWDEFRGYYQGRRSASDA